MDNNSTVCTVPDTQPILQGNDSLILSQPLSQSVVPETQVPPSPVSAPTHLSPCFVVPDSQQSPRHVVNETQSSPCSSVTTPPSRYGVSMQSALSQTWMTNEQESESLLPMRDLSAFRHDSPLSSTPANPRPEIKTVVTQDVSTETLPDPKCESVTQTSGPLLHGEFALFRSNGNLAVLSNFHAFKFKHYGTTYNSAEHAYQHQMALFHSCPETARRILRARNAPRAKSIANTVTKVEQWHEVKTSVMKEILLAKAKQCPEFKETLIKTDQRTLIHNIDTDVFWGCGPDLLGKNMMGKLLEELRQKLKQEQICEEQQEQICEEQPPSPLQPPAQPTVDVSTSEPTIELNTSQIHETAPVPPVPRTAQNDSVLVLGNSNARSMANLIDCDNTHSYFYPGANMDYIASRIQHTQCETHYPTHVILMAGDIEAANGLHPDVINAKFQRLVRRIRSAYGYSRLILVGLTPAGNQRRQTAIRRLNALMEHMASNERLIAYVGNNHSRLKDSIHLSQASKESLGRRIANIIKKPYLDALQRFR